VRTATDAAQSIELGVVESHQHTQWYKYLSTHHTYHIDLRHSAKAQQKKTHRGNLQRNLLSPYNHSHDYPRCNKTRWRLFISFRASLWSFACRSGHRLSWRSELSKSVSCAIPVAEVIGRQLQSQRSPEHVKNPANTAATRKPSWVMNPHAASGPVSQTTLYK
jgi:hypothetical protein